MIRASDLLGLPVVDLVLAEKIGKVDEIVLDPDARMLCAFIVRDGNFRRRQRAVPAERVYAIGPEALTLEVVAGAPGEADVAGLPTLGELAGRKVLSRHGKLLGTVADVLLAEDSGQIIGYALDVPHAQSGLGLFQKGKHLWPDYIRAEAPLRMSKTLIVTPDEALVRGEMTREEMEIRRIRTEPAIGWAKAPVLDAPVSPVLVRGPALASLMAPQVERKLEAVENLQTVEQRTIESHAA